MSDFNRMFIDTEELQSEITKVKNSLINSLSDKGTAEAAVIKTDISNFKSSNEDILRTIKNINVKIADLYSNIREITDKGDRTAALETKINNINTQKNINRWRDKKRDYRTNNKNNSKNQ